MRGIRSESIDLIYLDPPFNSKHDYAAPIGSKAAGAAFKDTWSLSDIDREWWGEISESHPALYKLLDAVQHVGGRSMMSYAIYMAVRIIEMHRILKPTGSLYLHCDPTAGHYLKLILDSVFGKAMFKNEIIWSYQRWTGATRHFQKMHDTIYLYGKSEEAKFTIIKEGYSKKSKHRGARFSKVNRDGKIEQRYTDDESRMKAMRDVWEISYLNSQSKERTGYPTQKPLALLERVIRASSDTGDVVFDPFCGCATTCLAAEKLGRKWIGIDISDLAAKLIKSRMLDAARAKDGEQETIDRFTTGAGQIIHRTDIPLQHIQRDPCIKNKLYGVQEGMCKGCIKHFEIRHMHVDHRTPRAKGGQDDDSNLQLLCGSCNTIKGTKTMAELRARLRELGILPER